MRRKKISLLILSTLIVMLCMAFLLFTGILRPNHLLSKAYAVHGVDVSHYQGNIDFARLEEQGMSFAYIKATEGSTHVDDCFAENLLQIQQSSMRPGFYHFFSYDSSGQTQAENFIAQVPPLPNMLPPVIDVEFYGDYFAHPAPVNAVVPELRILVNRLEEHYGMKPVIYCTQRAYRLYIREHFADCDLWIRNVYLPPFSGWTFWQYTDKAMLDGYSGSEPCIDVNVFAGSPEEFARYPS